MAAFCDTSQRGSPPVGGSPLGGTMDRVTTGEDLLEERRRRRRAGDPRITPEGREILLRLTTGDLMDDFQAPLDADVEADPVLGGHDADQQAIRRPHPEVLQVLDPRPLLDEAAAIGAAYGSPGLLVGETLAAGLVHGRRLWFGTARNVGKRLAESADDLGISLHVSEPDGGR